LFCISHHNRDRAIALENAKVAWAHGFSQYAAAEARKAAKITEHLLHKVVVALQPLCAVRLCDGVESDHAILAAYRLRQIDFVMSRDRDFIVMARLIFLQNFFFSYSV
jgi:hypothetical protein